VVIMATLLEEGVCVIRDKKVAERFLRDLINTPPTPSEEVEEMIRQIDKELGEGKKWSKRMKL